MIKSWTQAAKDAHWEGYIKAVFDPGEMEMYARLKLYFAEQAGRVTAAYLAMPKAPRKSALPFFDTVTEALGLSEVLKLDLYRILKAGAAYSMRQVGGDESRLLIKDRLMEAWAMRQGLRDSTRITRTTEAILRPIYVNGIEQGLGPNQIAGQIRASYEALTGVQEQAYRLRAIVRTETAKASTGGQLVGYATAGVEKKFWITSMDEVVRPTHQEAGDRYSEENAIQITEAFVVGGSVGMGPGLFPDPAESINCRCVLGYLYPDQYEPEPMSIPVA